MSKIESHAAVTAVQTAFDAEKPEPANSRIKSQQVKIHQAKAISELEERLVQEAVDAIEETKRAITAIEQNDRHAAVKAIELAAGELDVILAREPDLALLPVDYSSAIVHVGLEDLKEIECTRREIKSAIDFGYFAEARRLLDSLKNEICVTITCLPLTNYLDALRQAARLLDEEEEEAAQEILELALSSFVLESEYLPIPILTARSLIDDASVESDRAKAIQLLADARNQLKLSQRLGYGEADVEYDDLKKELENLEKQLKADRDSHHTFQELKTKIARFFQRISKEKK